MRETKLWTWHIIAGCAILVLLGVHMLTMHVGELTHIGVKFTEVNPAHPANSIMRDRNLMFTVGYILLLGAGLYHGLYGLRNILLELSARPGVRKAVNGVVVVAGLALFALGTWAAIAAHTAAGKAAG